MAASFLSVDMANT